MDMIGRDDLVPLFKDYFASRHCQLFGRHMPIHSDKERTEAAEWYANVVADVLALRHQPEE